MEVPIKFEYEGKYYTGEFNSVGPSGGVVSSWQLIINNYYKGELAYSAFADRWLFHSPSGKFKELEKYFEAYLTGWLSS